MPASSRVPAISSLLFLFDRHGYGFSWDGIVDVLHAPRDIQNTGCRNALQDDKDHNQVPKRWPHDSLSPHHSRSERNTGSTYPPSSRWLPLMFWPTAFRVAAFSW